MFSGGLEISPEKRVGLAAADTGATNASVSKVAASNPSAVARPPKNRAGRCIMTLHEITGFPSGRSDGCKPLPSVRTASPIDIVEDPIVLMDLLVAGRNGDPPRARRQWACRHSCVTRG